VHGFVDEFGAGDFLHHAYASIRGYAYETTPDQPILTGATSDPTNSSLTTPSLPPAPQPATLGLLAQGAPALSLWRREETQEGITD